MNSFGETGGFGEMFSDTPIFIKLFIGLVVVLVAGTFLYVIIKGISQWSLNNASQLLTRSCTVVDKRSEVWGGSGDSSANTSYYITFEFEDSTRVELPVNTKHYGLIVTGDLGELTYQGTRFKQFTRRIH